MRITHEAEDIRLTASEWLQLDVRENAGKARGRIRGAGIGYLSQNLLHSNTRINPHQGKVLVTFSGPTCLSIENGRSRAIDREFTAVMKNLQGTVDETSI
jgi:hypothetical protein